MKRKKNKPGQGRKAEGGVRINILMLPESVADMDVRRGVEPRGKWIARKLRLAGGGGGEKTRRTKKGKVQNGDYPKSH